MTRLIDVLGPAGGDGGHGGHVIITTKANTSSLSHVGRVITGKNGTKGRAKCQHGRNAAHTDIPVSFILFFSGRPHQIALKNWLLLFFEITTDSCNEPAYL